MESIPQWVGTAVLATVLGALTYIAKSVADLVIRIVATRKARRTRLAQLLALIRAGDAAFKVQANVRDDLQKMIKERLPELRSSPCTYDRLFAIAFQSMPPEERALFDIIRAYTIYTFKPLNDTLLAWLESDNEFRIQSPHSPATARLTEYLGNLEAHLLLWRAKYNAWIHEHPERALVYMEEGKHGAPFPKDGAAVVMAVLYPGGTLAPNSGLQFS
jgi:hypothetical protein